MPNSGVIFIKYGRCFHNVNVSLAGGLCSYTLSICVYMFMASVVLNIKCVTHQLNHKATLQNRYVSTKAR